MPAGVEGNVDKGFVLGASRSKEAASSGFNGLPEGTRPFLNALIQSAPYSLIAGNVERWWFHNTGPQTGTAINIVGLIFYTNFPRIGLQSTT